MKTYRNKVTGEYHTRLSDGTLSRGYASREELQQVIRRLQRNAAQRQREFIEYFEHEQDEEQ